MGLTYVEIELANPANPEERRKHQFLVDSGATFSVVPRECLEELDIRPHTRQEFNLANGQKIERDQGDALFAFNGRRGASPVIFGEPGDATLLGMVTLEALGFVLDPLRRELLPLPMLLATRVEGVTRHYA